jgi:hypothetical protein
MVIYTNNLAQKLFGFAISREQLRNTNLCDLLEDPNLQLDIDLAIDFNAAVRGDEDAAERFTNTFILSSAFLDYSTNDFYTTRMGQYPIFEYHVDRVTYIFNNLDNINDYYASASAREKNFIDSLKNALKDCLNSPCNLFAASSESIASIIDNVAASNSATIPPFSELRDLFKTTYGGIKNTLIKQVPDAVSDMIGKMAILGQDAFNQSVGIIYEKDKAKKDKLIADALAGKALDYDTTGYVYVPDIEAITSIEGFGASVLSQVASDLGGCFRKYQHLARYSPYDPNQNLSVTSREPIQENVDGRGGSRTTGGMWPFDYERRDIDLSCSGGDSSSTSSGVTPTVSPPSQNTVLSARDQYERVLKALQGSPLIGKIPNAEDARKYGFTNGSVEEWARFFTALANVESTFQPDKKGDINRFVGDSNGLYQLSPLDYANYKDVLSKAGIRNETTINGKPAFSFNQLFDPDINTKAAIIIAETNFLNKDNPQRSIGRLAGYDKKGNEIWKGLAAYWGPLKTESNQPIGRPRYPNEAIKFRETYSIFP